MVIPSPGVIVLHAFPSNGVLHTSHCRWRVARADEGGRACVAQEQGKPEAIAMAPHGERRARVALSILSRPVARLEHRAGSSVEIHGRACHVGGAV